MKRNCFRPLLALTLSLPLLTLGACSPSGPSADAPQSTDQIVETETQAPTEPPVPDVTFTVVGTGDVLSHMPVVDASLQDDGTYDYEPLVSEIKPFIEGADLALCHQEIPLTEDDADVSGYPTFAAPANWAQSTKDLGYDGCSTASNHSWDRARTGIENTLRILTEHGLGNTGMSTSPTQDEIQYYVLNKDGRDIKVAHLSFTYGLNYEYVPEVEENPWLVNVNDPEHIIELARKARNEGAADVVIVAPHGGVEYQAEPSDQQREWAKMFADSGVIDLYLGHHVHVPQPLEKIEGGVDGKGMWAFFGTGNLLSNMQPPMGMGTQTGYIAHATITVPAKGAAHVDEAGYIGVLLDSETDQIFLASTYTQADHPGSYLDDARASEYYAHLKAVMGDAKEITTAPSEAAPPVKVLPRK